MRFFKPGCHPERSEGSPSTPIRSFAALRMTAGGLALPPRYHISCDILTLFFININMLLIYRSERYPLYMSDQVSLPPNYFYHRLANGIEMIGQYMPSLSSITFGFQFDAAVIHEPE